MINKRNAHRIRFILGIVIALGMGIDSYFAERGAIFTYVLPAAIALLTIADAIGYLTDRPEKAEMSGARISDQNLQYCSDAVTTEFSAPRVRLGLRVSRRTTRPPALLCASRCGDRDSPCFRGKSRISIDPSLIKHPSATFLAVHFSFAPSLRLW